MRRNDLSFLAVPALAVCGWALAVPAMAADTYTESVPVVSATPVYEHTGQGRMRCTEPPSNDEGGDDQAPGGKVEQCRLVPDQPLGIVGYDVRYRINGREYVTRLPEDPGSHLLVHIDVAAQAPVK